jgi:hypothetical protein
MPIPVWLIPAIMGAMAVQKSMNDQKNVEKKADLAAATDRYSPWTGLHGQMPDAIPDPGMTAASAALSGYGMSQGIASADKLDALTAAQTKYIEGLPQVASTGSAVATPGIEKARETVGSQSMIPGQLGSSELSGVGVDPLMEMKRRMALAQMQRGQFMPYSMGY